MAVEISTTRVSATAHPLSIQEIRQSHNAELDDIARFRRVTNYLTAAELYLKSNVLLQRPLKPEDIKDRLLGHWSQRVLRRKSPPCAVAALAVWVSRSALSMTKSWMVPL